MYLVGFSDLERILNTSWNIMSIAYKVVVGRWKRMWWAVGVTQQLIAATICTFSSHNGLLTMS